MSNLPFCFNIYPQPFTEHAWNNRLNGLLRSLHCRFIGEPKFDPKADDEQAIEGLLRLDAALRYLPANSVFRIMRGSTPLLDRDGDPYENPPELDGLPHWGPVSSEHLTDDLNETANAPRYAESPAFRNVLAGRYCELLPADSRLIDRKISERKTAGRTTVLKYVRREKTLPVMVIQPDSETFHADDWLGYYGEPEDERAVLLQDDCHPICEYRCFILGNHVVTAAGCIERFTPLEHVGEGSYDSQMQQERADDSPVETRPELADRMIRWVEDAAIPMLAAERLIHGPYVMDLYVDKTTNHIGILELNCVRNAGLYAANVDALTRAAVERATEFIPWSLNSLQATPML